MAALLQDRNSFPPEEEEEVTDVQTQTTDVQTQTSDNVVPAQNDLPALAMAKQTWRSSGVQRALG